MAKMMERQGGDPRLWAERSLREKGIERDSRTGHELSVVTNVFYQGGIYAQLNVGGLGSLEVVCRRIAMLVEALSQPHRPNWAAARHLEGAPMSEAGLRSNAMRRAKKDVDIQNAQHRSYTRSSAANEDDKEVRDGKGEQERASGACSLGARWMKLLDAAWEMARHLPQYTEPGDRPKNSLSFSKQCQFRDLFPLRRDPQRNLPPRVETLRRHLVDDALSALNWLSGKREPFPPALPSLYDARGCVHRPCANSFRGLVQGLTGSRRPRQWCGIFHTGSLSVSKLSMPRGLAVCSLCCPTRRGAI